MAVSEFSSHVERYHADRDKLFEMEYTVSQCEDVHLTIRDLHETQLQNISKTPMASYSISELPHNKLKNRFANIFPCESSLTSLDGILIHAYFHINR